MPLDKIKLKAGISGLYKTVSLEAALDQWDNLLKNYFFDHTIKNFKPVSATSIKPLFQKSVNDKTFIDDFAKNLSNWTKSVVWSDGKDNKNLIASNQLNFVAFAKIHEKDTDGNVYINALVDLLHDWFSSIESF